MNHTSIVERATPQRRRARMALAWGDAPAAGRLIYAKAFDTV